MRDESACAQGPQDEQAGDELTERPKSPYAEARMRNESELRSQKRTKHPEGPGGGSPGDIDSSHSRQDCRTSQYEGSSSIMTVADVCAELGVARSTFHHWRATGRGPRTFRLPNRAIRILRVDFMSWLRTFMGEEA